MLILLIILGLRSLRRYSPYVRYSLYRKLSRDFSLGSSSSGDLEIAQPSVSTCTSCGRPFPVDNGSLDCSIQASFTSEPELEARPVVRDLREPEEDVLDCSIQASIIPERELEARPVVCDLREPVEDDQEKEMAFFGAYPIEQVVYVLHEPANLPPRHSVKVVKKKYLESEVYHCPTDATVYPSAQYGFKELFFRFLAYFFDW